jgi:malonate-semialdehyde dehydrogenase (acetylating)/methylmalonate-semialdehyde dehydrogenase
MLGDSLMNVADGYDTVTFREPMGVFVGIVPWNFPAMIPMGWMMPLAVTTGNTFVLKAASYVPQTAMRMAELLEEAGLPPGVFNLVTCSRDEAEQLLTHPDVQGVSFVGSTSVGRHIYATAAANGKPSPRRRTMHSCSVTLRSGRLRSALSTLRSDVPVSAAWLCL